MKIRNQIEFLISFSKNSKKIKQMHDQILCTSVCKTNTNIPQKYIQALEASSWSLITHKLNRSRKSALCGDSRITPFFKENEFIYIKDGTLITHKFKIISLSCKSVFLLSIHETRVSKQLIFLISWVPEAAKSQLVHRVQNLRITAKNWFHAPFRDSRIEFKSSHGKRETSSNPVHPCTNCTEVLERNRIHRGDLLVVWTKKSATKAKS